MLLRGPQIRLHLPTAAQLGEQSLPVLLREVSARRGAKAKTALVEYSLLRRSRASLRRGHAFPRVVLAPRGPGRPRGASFSSRLLHPPQRVACASHDAMNATSAAATCGERATSAASAAISTMGSRWATRWPTGRASASLGASGRGISGKLATQSPGESRNAASCVFSSPVHPAKKCLSRHSAQVVA